VWCCGLAEVVTTLVSKLGGVVTSCAELDRMQKDAVSCLDGERTVLSMDQMTRLGELSEKLVKYSA
jgi:hypothetical protein